MTESRTLREADDRAACASLKVGDVAWLFHHEVVGESLTDAELNKAFAEHDKSEG
jgi:hypothetical protein